MINGIYHVKYSVRNSLDKLEHFQSKYGIFWYFPADLKHKWYNCRIVLLVSSRSLKVLANSYFIHNLPKSFRLLNSLMAVATSFKTLMASWILSRSGSSSGEYYNKIVTCEILKTVNSYNISFYINKKKNQFTNCHQQITIYFSLLEHSLLHSLKYLSNPKEQQEERKYYLPRKSKSQARN